MARQRTTVVFNLLTSCVAVQGVIPHARAAAGIRVLKGYILALQGKRGTGIGADQEKGWPPGYTNRSWNATIELDRAWTWSG